LIEEYFIKNSVGNVALELMIQKDSLMNDGWLLTIDEN
jgi:hypothetical protein